MSAPQLTKNWTITPNLRRTFTSLVDTVGWCVYQNRAALLAAGWSVVWSCDGTTGPANAADHTARITDPTKFATRATVAAAPQSWLLLQNADGVQLLFCYQGASDDIFRISYSPTGAFTLAGTTTNQPTATDENVIISATSLVSATLSGDRVMSIWCTSDSKAWSFAMFRAGAQTSGCIGLERVNNLCAAGVFDIPYVSYRYTAFDHIVANTGRPCGGITNVVAGATGWLGASASVVTAGSRKVVRVGGGEICMATNTNTNAGAASTTNATYPSLQGGTGIPLLPIIWSGEKLTADGFIGSPIDAWQAYSALTSTPGFGDFLPGYDPGDTPGVTTVRTNWLVGFGSGWVRPWRNAAAAMETT